MKDAMAADKRTQSAVAAAQRGLSRVAVRVAALTFWQFVLFAIILLAAAGIAEGLWVKSPAHHVRIVDDRGADAQDASGERGAKTPSAEIRIDEDGVTIRRKQSAKNAAKDAAATPEHLTEKDVEAIVKHASRPPLVTITLLLVMALFVVRLFARAQQRAEKRVEAAQASADREALQRQLVEARLQLLQAQVEPHFLFNTLAAVEHLIETAPNRAAQMQRHLIDYLRASLPHMRRQSATLGKEIELCVSYLKIMQMRMEERLKFEVAVPAGLASALLPPMLLQSLVENAVRHGLEPKPEGGTVALSAEVRDGKLRVTVADTGMGFSAGAGTGIGLANIRDRLQQLFGEGGALIIEANAPAGTRATISVPYAVA